MKHFFENWRTSLGGILYAAGYLPAVGSFAPLLQSIGVLLLGGAAADAKKVEKSGSDGSPA